jgi:hypothetical protein
MPGAGAMLLGFPASRTAGNICIYFLSTPAFRLFCHNRKQMKMASLPQPSLIPSWSPCLLLCLEHSIPQARMEASGLLALWVFHHLVGCADHSI